MTINFATLFFEALFLAFVVYLSRRFQATKPALFLSHAFEPPSRKTFKMRLHLLQRPLRFGALACFCIALAHPEQGGYSDVTKQEVPKKGIAIYLLVDRSGSMQEKISNDVAKIDWVREATTEFIQKRPNDLIGLVAFARKPDLLAPLTIDHASILAKIKEIQPATTEAEDGTAIGYAIFKTVNLIVATKHFAEDMGRDKNAYAIKNQVIVIMTDGLQTPNPLDRSNPYRFIGLENAAHFAAENNCRIYFAGVVPQNEQNDFMNQMEPFKEAVEETGGQFYLTPDRATLEHIYESIDHIEKSDVTPQFIKVRGERKSLIPFFIALGLVLLLGSIAIETIFAKVTP